MPSKGIGKYNVKSISCMKQADVPLEGSVFNSKHFHREVSNEGDAVSGLGSET